MFNTLYALPDFAVKKDNWSDHIIESDAQAPAGAMIAVDLANEDYGVLDYDVKPGNNVEEVYQAHRETYPAFFENTRIERSGNGGYHVYFRKTEQRLRQTALGAGIDVFDGHDHRWMVVPPSRYKNGKTAEYVLLQDNPVLALPDDLRARLTAPREAERTGVGNMPALITPHDVEGNHVLKQHPYGEGWDAEGTGRNERLYKLVREWYFAFTGTPQQRMGKALWIADCVLAMINSDDPRYRSIEAFWSKHQGLTKLVEEGKGEPVATPVTENAPTGLVLRSFSEVEVERLRWTWKNMMPIGALTLLVGNEGVGKSTVALDLAASLSRGVLPGEYYGTPHATVVCASEDSSASIIKPRLMAANADMNLVHEVKVSEEGFMLPRDLDALGEEVKRLDIKLVIIDSLATASGHEIKPNDYQSVTKALAPINKWAESLGITALVLWHTNKSDSEEGRNRLSGSAAFRACARSMIIIDRERTADGEETTGLVTLDKSNGGSTNVSPLRYSLRSTDVTAKGEVYNTAKVVWHGEASSEDVARARKAGSEPRKSAKQWLHEYLSDGEQHSREEVLKAAAAAGHAESSIGRAKAQLDVKTEDSSQTRPDGPPIRKSMWSLPSEQWWQGDK